MKYDARTKEEIGEMVLVYAELLASNQYPGNTAVIPLQLANKMVAFVELKKPGWQKENFIEFWDEKLHGEFVSGV